MPVPGALWPIIRVFLQKHGWRALWRLIEIVGLEPIIEALWGFIQGRVGRQADRRRAFRKADQVGGRVGSAIFDDGVRWVVFKDERPISAFPGFDGDLVKELELYDRSLLTHPSDRPSRRARAWFGGRIESLRRQGSTDRNGSSEPAGAGDFKRVVDGLAPTLASLTSAPRRKLAEHPLVPKVAGIYLFSEHGAPIYVGQSRNLYNRLRQHSSASSRENSAPFAYNLALKEAREQELALAGSRKEIAASPEFAALFKQARGRVAQMDVQFIELADPVERTIFEVYAARVLGTDEFNSFETH